jgi:predicted DNA binding CopG/RHH family protein
MKTKIRKNFQLDAYEREIARTHQSGKLERIPGEGEKLVRAAKATLAKSKRVNIRISENDLDALRLRAARDGLPYQTLMGSVLHKYATGILREAEPDYIVSRPRPKK